MAKLYSHFQFGGQEEFHLDASTLNFSGTSQTQLGLAGMTTGESRMVNLFDAGVNENSLAFGRLLFTLMPDGSFGIAPNRFNFDFNNGGSLARDGGTLLAGAVNYNVIPAIYFRSPLFIAIPVIFGGPFDVVFHGTATVPNN